MPRWRWGEFPCSPVAVKKRPPRGWEIKKGYGKWLLFQEKWRSLWSWLMPRALPPFTGMLPWGKKTPTSSPKSEEGEADPGSPLANQENYYRRERRGRRENQRSQKILYLVLHSNRMLKNPAFAVIARIVRDVAISNSLIFRKAEIASLRSE